MIAIRSRVLRRFLLCVIPAVLALGCRDTLSPRTRLPRPARNEVLVRLVVSPGDQADTYVVRAVTTRGGAFEAPTAFQTRLQFPAGVTFVEDASRGSAFLRAMNVVNGELRVAGAAAQGDDNEELFAVRVQSSDAAHLSQIVLQVIEFRDRSGRDQRSALRILPAYREIKR